MRQVIWSQQTATSWIATEYGVPFDISVQHAVIFAIDHPFTEKVMYTGLWLDNDDILWENGPICDEKSLPLAYDCVNVELQRIGLGEVKYG